MDDKKKLVVVMTRGMDDERASVAWSILFSDTILVLSFGKLSPLDPECLRVRLVERQARDTFSPKKLEARLLE